MRLSAQLKYYIGLILISLFSVFMSGRIDYHSPKYATIDLEKYIKMAEAAPGLNTQVLQPYVYRIAAPWLAGMLPLDIPASFFLLNLPALLLMVFCVFVLLQMSNIRQPIAFLVTVCFIFNRYFFQFYAWDYFMLQDTLSCGLLFFSIILIIRQQWVWLAVIMFACTLTREIGLLALPVGLAYIFSHIRQSKAYVDILFASLPSILFFFIIRILIKPAAGDDLLIKFLEEGLAFLFTKEAFLKTLIVPFTPFSLFPILFIQEWWNFFKEHLYLIMLLACTLFTTLFGLDFERLMTPALLTFYTFLALVFQKYYDCKFLYILAPILAVFGSFNHLWGVLRYPSRIWTLVITFVLMGVTALIFAVWKSKCVSAKTVVSAGKKR